MSSIAQKVLEVRKRLGLSQSELGDRINYSRTYISMIERGVQERPDAEFIERIDALNRHAEPAHESAVVREDPPTFMHLHQPIPAQTAPPPRTPHENYAEAVNIMGALLEHCPESLEDILPMLRRMCGGRERKQR